MIFDVSPQLAFVHISIRSHLPHLNASLCGCREPKFDLCGAQLSCLCILATCMVVLLGNLIIYCFTLVHGLILWTNTLKMFYSPELGVYAYAAAQVKKAIEVGVKSV